jgi:AcrR family transcriptional regulator
MGGRIREGKSTRDRLADGLLKILQERRLSSISVKELTENTGVNRQTFYYHFSDIYDLAEYTYDREIAKIFSLETVDETFDSVDPFSHSEKILDALRGSSQGLMELLTFFSRRNPKGHFYELIRRRAIISHSPRLRAAGVSEKAVGLFEEMWSTAVTAIVVDWLHRGFEMSTKQLVQKISDYSNLLVKDVIRMECPMTATGSTKSNI